MQNDSGIGVYIADHVSEQDKDDVLEAVYEIYDDIGDEFDHLDAPL